MEGKVYKNDTPSKLAHALTQVCIFCEGSRFTEAKHEKGLQFAREKGLKELKYHLIPRTKGFSVLAKHLKTTGEGNFFSLVSSASVCVDHLMYIRQHRNDSLSCKQQF